MATPLNIIFAGTPEFAADHLQALIDSSHNVIAVYTQPDKPAGRGKRVTQSAVKKLALEHNLPVLQPKSLRNTEAQAELQSLNADVMVVVAYGLLLPQAILDTPKFGCLNVHGSLLPKWRGAAPIQRSIWAGDKESGVTIMQMDVGLDTGAMLHKVTCPIEANETSETLYQKLASIAPNALLSVLNGLREQRFTPVAQQEQESTYAQKLSKQEAKLNWHQSAVQLERNIRAFNPWPICYFTLNDPLGNEQILKVYQANVIEKESKNKTVGQVLALDKNGLQIVCAEGILNITQLQPAGKKPMSIADFINGRADWIKQGMILA